MNPANHSSHLSDTREPTVCKLPRRLAAMAYDSLLLLAIWMLAAALIVIPFGNPSGVGKPLFQLYLLTVTWAYFAICWRGGQTLGMKAWRLRISAPETPIGWGRSLIRFLVALISLTAFGVGFLWSLFHPQRATWHDLASGSRLLVEPRPVRKKSASQPAQQKAGQADDQQSGQ
jgi:uncharacterized RDD family membrane protein YckC